MDAITPYIIFVLTAGVGVIGFFLRVCKERIERLEVHIEKVEDRQREHNDRLYKKLEAIAQSITELRLEMATRYVSKEEAKAFEKRKGDK